MVHVNGIELGNECLFGRVIITRFENRQAIKVISGGELRPERLCHFAVSWRIDGPYRPVVQHLAKSRSIFAV